MPEIFNLDAVAAEAQDRMFEFTLGGRVRRMKNLKDIHAVLLEDENLGTDLKSVIKVVRAAADPADIDDILALGATAVSELGMAWMAHAGIDIPKSEPSETSSENTAKPSKRPSKRTTASRSRTSSQGASASAGRSSSSGISPPALPSA
jgi:hypothetical protein